MQITNRDEYKEVAVSTLRFSRRTFNCLMRAGYDTLYLVIENYDNLSDIRNMGKKSLDEVDDLLCDIAENGISHLLEQLDEEIVEDTIEAKEEDTIVSVNLPPEILSRPATDLKIPIRICNVFCSEGIETIEDVLKLRLTEIHQMHNMGTKSIRQLREQIGLLCELGENYFTNNVATEEEEDTTKYSKRELDIATAKQLMDFYDLKSAWLCDWYDCSRQRIYQKLAKRVNHGNWCGKQLLPTEITTITEMINTRLRYCDTGDVKYYFVNNTKDDCAYLIIYDDEIKCFFLKDFPENLQEEIKTKNLHKYTERELAGDADGEITYVIKEPQFAPTYPDKFRSCAQQRGMTADEYALFISGYHIARQGSINDKQITDFFDKNLVEGKVYISSDPKNQWIKSFASRNGFNIRSFIEFYGYESKLDGTELTSDGARKHHIEELKKYLIHDNVVYFHTDSRIYRLLNTYCHSKGYSMDEYIKSLGFERTKERPQVHHDKLEMDMQVRQCSGGFEEKVFAKYPLIGSRILSPEMQEKLNGLARKYIDKVLQDPTIKLPLQAEMQITIALINNAKNWKNEENGNFWEYTALQFGYRDASGTVERLLKSSLEHSMKKNNRLFFEDANGRAFKSTAVIHALTTRKSWMALFDFLFDFYKNNLNWKVIPNDTLITVMIHALQQKLTGDSSEDAKLTISSRVYSFQEGIRKLILYRPEFTCDLFERLILRIHALVNSEETSVKTYEEQLCEDWFKEKITAISNSKRTERQRQVTPRDVAINYSKIHAKYVLKNETEIQVVLPDIRLEHEDVDRAIISIYCNDSLALQKEMSWYGNELGRTLNGVSISLPDVASDDGMVRVQVKIRCDNEEIYNSDDTLNRKLWVFYGNNELKVNQIEKSNYTVVIPQGTILETENITKTEIGELKNLGLQAFFLELKDEYALMLNGQAITFDTKNETDIRIISPEESAKLPCVTIHGKECNFAYRNSVCNIILGNVDNLQRFVVLRNGEKVDFSTLVASDNGLAFIFPLASDGDVCRFQIIDLANEKLKLDKEFILIDEAECGFNRKFYYSAADYQNAEFKVIIDNFEETVPFWADDDEIRIPFRDGELHIEVPKIKLQETSGEWQYNTEPAWYIGSIPQTSMMRVSAPTQTRIRFYVGGNDIMYDGNGVVTIGNVLQSLRDVNKLGTVDVTMEVSCSTQSQKYVITRVYYKEGFLSSPHFWTKDEKLYWDQGTCFIGKPNRKFTLSLFGETDVPVEFQIDESTERVEITPEIPIGNYRYEISIQTGSIFKMTNEIIAEGDCIIGDENLLRFRNRRIAIESITDEFNESAGHISINTCYIDKVEFGGIEETSEGYCPVYSGVMYTEGNHGERYEFSFDSHTNKRGIKKIMVNPVRIVYINTSTLCITDSEGDGLYYYHYYNSELCKKVYALTDRAYSSQNRHVYANADLYLYTTERI